MAHPTGTLPTFETARLRLRPRVVDDLEPCLAMDRDPLVTRYIPGPWHDPARHREFVLARMAEAYPAGLGFWTVRPLAGPDVFLGWILLLPYALADGEVEIGWRFTWASWGNGYAGEAAAPVLDHAFRTVGLKAVVADIHPLNLASMRVAEKIGMSLVGERRVEGIAARRYRATPKPA